MKFELKCAAFANGEQIPVEYTGEGEDRSPALEWTNPPSETEEFALICEDPDAPQEKPWVHWVLYRISGDIRKIPAGLPHQEQLDLPPDALQGRNSFGNFGYGGPLPPVGHGPHRYYFTLYALAPKIHLRPGASKEELLDAMSGHILAAVSILGKYARNEPVKKAG
jgi:Raf kinase inhibitor-like YbhB/YbcL family protein